MSDPSIVPHMDVIGSDGGHVGTVDRLEPGHVKLTREDDPAGLGGHRMIPLDAIAGVEPGRVRLLLPAAQARAMAAGGHHPAQLEEGFEDTGVTGPEPSGLGQPGTVEDGGARSLRGEARDGSGAGGPGFRGDPNMDPSGRGEV